MRDIRLLSGEGFEEYADIAFNAYPGFQIATEEGRQRLIDRLKEFQDIPVQHIVGLYREGKLLGGMRLFDFRMNMLGIEVSAGGVGMVAVDLVHKKEHVAKEMLTYFHEHYKGQGANVVLLYPFKPGFYYAMGYGYGAKVSQYRFQPAALRKGLGKEHVRFLIADDKPALMDCYNRYQARTHGMMIRYPPEWDGWFKNLGLQNRLVGYERDGRIEGYIFFKFHPRPVENLLRNDIVIQEFVYTSRAALAGLLEFLRTQADQIDRIVLTTADETFQHLLTDPRNECQDLIPSVYHESNVQGVGLMVRILDVAGIFRDLAERNFNGQSCRLRLTARDSFFPENDGSTLIHFEQGRATLPEAGGHDVEVTLDIAEFSSLLMGVIGFRRLHLYGLAEISDESYLDTIQRIFAVEQKPICMTAF